MIEGPKCHDKGIVGYGNPDYGIVIVGIAPGSNEISTGKPFVGSSGKLLDAILEAVGWSRDKVYCTNLVCTWENSPSRKMIDACMPRLLKELSLVKPKLIICMGKIVSEVFGCDTRGVLKDMGSHYLMSTIHPAAILHGSSIIIPDLVRDLSKIPIVVDFNGKPSAVEYKVAESTEEVQCFLNNQVGQTYVAVDIETTMPDYGNDEVDIYSDKLLCLAISNGKETIVLPFELAQGLKWPELNYTFHNGMFDVQGIRKFLGVKLPIIHDTMLMSYACDERSGQHNLKLLSREYLGAGYYEKDIKKNRNKMDAVPDSDLYKYNALDAAYTARLAPILSKLMQREKVTDLYSNLLLSAANMFAEVQYRGVNIDEVESNRIFVEWAPQWLDLDSKLLEFAKTLGHNQKLNSNSPKQLSHVLYDLIGLPGGPSTDKEHLEALKGKHPFVDLLLEYRGIDKMISSYILGVQDDIKRDGRVHSSVLLHGTTTGRLSYRRPPLQTIPKPHKVGEKLGRVRKMFAATSGYILVEADYRQAEIFVAAYESGDEQMKLDLQGDIHRSTASSLFGVEFDKVNKLQRSIAKNINFGMFYGLTPEGFVEDMKTFCKVYGVDIEETGIDLDYDAAEWYFNRWRERYKTYYAYSEKLKQTAIEDGELVSISGRKRRFYLVYGEKAYHYLNQAINYPVQSGASDCTLTSAIELHPQLEAIDAHILILVHDSLLAEATPENLKPAIKLIHNVMTKPRFPGYPSIPVEISIGPNWFDMKEIDLKEYI